jgi:hypothetical protein
MRRFTAHVIRQSPKTEGWLGPNKFANQISGLKLLTL